MAVIARCQVVITHRPSTLILDNTGSPADPMGVAGKDPTWMAGTGAARTSGPIVGGPLADCAPTTASGGTASMKDPAPKNQKDRIIRALAANGYDDTCQIRDAINLGKVSTPGTPDKWRFQVGYWDSNEGSLAHCYVYLWVEGNTEKADF
jgi:hypothetical protein